ncbi:MAG: CoA pyrophosphatase [Paludibacter sp.]|nr:CoA pyrophosphatase [Paludibacter sp.]
MLLSKQELKLKLSKPLPGIHSHLKMAPEHRAEQLMSYDDGFKEAKIGAVLILFYHENDDLKMIVIRRSNYVGIHAGQIAFPGGRYEEEDKNVMTTALREIEEEIGITKDKIEIIGQLSDIYIPPSNFLISVFVGYLDEKPMYKIEELEVEEVIEVPFGDFFKPHLIKEKEFFVSSLNASSKAPYFDVTNAEIWGASAMVISELLDLIN